MMSELVPVLESIYKLAPEDFVSKKNKALVQKVQDILKLLFDFGRKSDRHNAGSNLDSLVVDGFDSEQIWAMLELENKPMIKYIEKLVRKLNRSHDEVEILDVPSDNEIASEDEDDEAEDSDANESDENEEEEDDGDNSELEDDDENMDDDEELDDESAGSDIESGDSQVDENEVETTEIDDDHFKLREMDRFATMMEERDSKLMREIQEIKDRAQAGSKSKKRKAEEDDYSSSDEDAEDEEQDDDSSDFSDEELDDDDGEGADYTYEDFFGKKENFEQDNKKRMSSFQKKKKELQQQIEALEMEALAEKPWTMKGETHSRERPKNAILEQGDLDVEYISRPAPTITEEITLNLEDMIKQRVLNSDFDDVVRKLASEIASDYRQKPELSMEKSKEGLGEQYAKDYEVQVMGHTPEESKQRTEQQEALHLMFTNLCNKLDALSNFHYTPKVVLPEKPIQPLNVAAIQMEDVLPTATSTDVSAAAPEQILAKKTGRAGVGKSTEELSQDERKRLRQSKKAAKRLEKRRNDRESKVVSKLNPGLGNKYAKPKVTESGSDNVKWTKSSAFFQKVQDANMAPEGQPSKLKKPKVEFAGGATYRL